MKNRNHFLYIVILLLGAGVQLTSCDSFVDTGLPNSQLTGEAVFENATTANAALSNLYSDIRDKGMFSGNQAGLSNTLGVYTDELGFYGSNAQSGFYFYNNALVANNFEVASYWTTAYNQIYQANAIIEGLSQSQTILQQDKDRMTGEALAIRAFLHMYLTGIFGAVPYVDSTDYNVNTRISKLDQDDVYTTVIADLLEALAILPENNMPQGRARINREVVQALLSRVYLYTGNWSEAAEAASLVIEQSADYSLSTNIENTFLKESPETLWQLPPATEGNYTAMATTFTVLTAPPSASVLSDGLINGFEAADNRKQYWTGQVTDGTAVWYYPAKYKQTTVESTSSEYTVIFRLAELHLIRAEARLMLGDITGAKSDINLIRERAGLLPTSATTQNDLLQAVARERRFEFFTEFGHRFFDLKRTGQLDATLTPVKQGWDNHDALFPLPESELILNPNLLPQNTGY